MCYGIGKDFVYILFLQRLFLHYIFVLIALLRISSELPYWGWGGGGGVHYVK